MVNFYISITTIVKYKVALDMLLASLPTEWKNKYILVYQNEETNSYEVFDDGHIEVKITNNLSDYGNWVGVNILLQNNIIPADSWFLFVHDTTTFQTNSAMNLEHIINEYALSNIDILWLSDRGQCNICLIRKNGIEYGYNLYKDIKSFSKIETIQYEWDHWRELSPKSFKVIQIYINEPTKYIGQQDIYNTGNIRKILYYKPIDMYKFYVDITYEHEHPKMP
jgi:hypothetical protein